MTASATRAIPALASFVQYLESGTAPVGLFADDIFADLSFPQWRLQATSAVDLLAIRSTSHPWPGRVRVERADCTEDGFAAAVEERWTADGQSWYCREFFRADVVDDTIVDLTVVCTGDWDEAQQRHHAESVTLVRP